MPTLRRLPAPMLPPVLGWTGGMILARFLPFNPLISIASCFTVILAASFLTRLRPLLVILLFVCLGALRLQMVPNSQTPLRILLAQKHSIRQQLVFDVHQQFSSTRTSYGVINVSMAGKPLKANLIFSSESELQPGRRYRALADISELIYDPVLDMYPHKYEAQARQLGKVELLSTHNLKLWVSGLRLKLLQNLDARLGVEAGWAKALLLSDTEVKTAYQDVLRQSGTLHLIVVSGLHVYFIYLVLVNLLRVFFPRRVAEWLFLPVIILFAALNNWAPSITRSIIMIAIYIIAHQLQRPISGFQILSISLLVITLIQPLQLFTLGLQLSFICVAVILLGLPTWEGNKKKQTPITPARHALVKARDAVTISLLSSLAIAPITLYHFGQASLNGIVANLLGIPLSSVLICLSAAMMFLPRGSWMCNMLANSYLGLIWLWKKWIEFCAGLPLSINGTYFNGFRAVALAIGIAWAAQVIKGRWKLALRLALPALAIILSLLFLPQLGKQHTDIHVFAAGTADCSLIRLADGQRVLIDTGGIPGVYNTDLVAGEETLESQSWAARNLLPWLSRKGIRSLDYLIVSHMHLDHCGGLPALATNLRIKRLIIPASALQSPFWQALKETPGFNPEKVYAISDTCSFSNGNLSLKFLNPSPAISSEDENSSSLVCRVDVPGSRLLFCGDINSETEDVLVSAYAAELTCTYLKAPHHGSRHSSSSELLRATHAREAWITCGRNNRFGFPHEESLARYREAQISLRRTDGGSIHLLLP